MWEGWPFLFFEVETLTGMTEGLRIALTATTGVAVFVVGHFHSDNAKDYFENRLSNYDIVGAAGGTLFFIKNLMNEIANDARSDATKPMRNPIDRSLQTACSVLSYCN